MVCRRCGPSTAEFSRHPSARDGQDTICKPCAALIARERLQAHRQRVLDAFGNRCQECGFDDRRALQIDHVHGGGRAEKARLGLIRMYKRMLEHPEDYQLLCANCHAIKTVTESTVGVLDVV